MDLGYRFSKNSIDGKIGVEAYLFFVGLQIDFAYRILLDESHFNPGFSYYLIGTLPIQPWLVFFRLGGQTYFPIQYHYNLSFTEFNLSLSVLFNINREGVN